jgi:hypothetical protein
MKRTTRFWIETVLAAICVVSLVLTFLWKEWIEIIFHVDPDNGSGAAEWWLAIGSGVLAVVFAVAARVEWRRIQASPV